MDSVYYSLHCPVTDTDCQMSPLLTRTVNNTSFLKAWSRLQGVFRMSDSSIESIEMGNITPSKTHPVLKLLYATGCVCKRYGISLMVAICQAVCRHVILYSGISFLFLTKYQLQGFPVDRFMIWMHVIFLYSN